MRLRLAQLEQHLKGALKPAYLLSADEPLQLEEALDQIRAAARAQGFDERLVMYADTGFDWNELLGAGASMSLFSTKQILDVRMPGKPGTVGGKALAQFAQIANPDTLLIISTGKLEPRARQSAWYKALDKLGVTIDIWPVQRAQLTDWVRQRARQRGLELAADAAQLLAERHEGNLLACAQEIDKLCLAHGEATLDFADVAAGVGDSARFDAFALVDSMLDGDGARAMRIVRGLREEGTNVIQVLGPLTWALRALAGLSHEVSRGASLDALLGHPRHRMWKNRRQSVQGALSRHSAARWSSMLGSAARIDRLIKGATGRLEAGRRQVPLEPWNALGRLVLLACRRV